MHSVHPLPREWGRVGPGGVSLRAPFLHVPGQRGQWRAFACPLPARTGRRGQRGRGGAGGIVSSAGERERARQRRALVPTRSVRMGREAPGREGEGEPGVTVRRDGGVPTHVPSKRHGHGGRGHGVPLCAAFLRERSGADRGAGEGKKRERLTPRAMKGKEWGVGLSPCILSSTRMRQATGMGGGREGEWRRGEGMRRWSFHRGG
ncbi:hypothetical protein EDB85DRAFT_1989125 [Lactarius pseudohatsudake]|nr:hypothetical protein EDB85DRAFT_1989125 [Lactarius pseudohatsudake]